VFLVKSGLRRANGSDAVVPGQCALFGVTDVVARHRTLSIGVARVIAKTAGWAD